MLWPVTVFSRDETTTPLSRSVRVFQCVLASLIGYDPTSVGPSVLGSVCGLVGTSLYRSVRGCVGPKEIDIFEQISVIGLLASLGATSHLYEMVC